MALFLLHPSVFPHDRDFRCFLLPRFFERLFWNIQFEPWPLPFIKNEVHHKFHLFDIDIILSMWNWTIDVDVTGLHIFCTRGYFHTPLFSHFDTSRWFHHVLNSPWHNCVYKKERSERKWFRLVLDSPTDNECERSELITWRIFPCVQQCYFGLPVCPRQSGMNKILIMSLDHCHTSVEKHILIKLAI